MEYQNETSPRARIAWLSPRRESFKIAAPFFEKAGYAVSEAPLERGTDVAVVDVRHHRVSARTAQEIASKTRRIAPECGIVYLGGSSLSPTERAHLRRTGDFLTVGDDLGPAVDVCRNRLRIRAIAEETGERLKSIAASTRLSEFPPIDTASAPPSVLIAGAPGPTALAALTAAESVAANCGAALSASQALRALESGLFDVAVFLPGAEGDPLISLARSMRRHKQFLDLPVIMASPDNGPRLKLATANAAEAILPAHIGDDLPARIVAVARRARLIGAMRRFLTACAGDGVRDPRAGVFTPHFLAQHAERVFLRSEQTGRPVSLIGLRLAPAAGDDAAVKANRTLTEAARLINRVTRAEDCVGRLTRDTFLILMNGANGADAEAASRRVEGVIANTLFRSSRSSHLFPVAAAAAARERQAGDRLDETIARVMAALNGATPRTAER